MKKITFALICGLCLSAVITCASCAAKPININLLDLSDYIGQTIDLSNSEESDASYIQNYYGIKPEDVKQISVLKVLDVNSAEVIILAEAVDKAKANEISDNLKYYKTNKLNELKDYTANPNNEAQYYIVEKSEIWTDQNYVFWAVNDKTADIDKVIKDYIKNNNK